MNSQTKMYKNMIFANSKVRDKLKNLNTAYLDGTLNNDSKSKASLFQLTYLYSFKTEL